jgi:hypothetical protein
MAIAYESSTETALGAANSIDIVKPSGLAVGDHMFAQIIGGYGAGGAAITPPAGWTTYYNATETLSGRNCPLGIFYKEAVSGDVAASNFTFTVSDGAPQEYLGGAIVRVSGFGIIDGASSRGPIGLATGTDTYASGIDPTFPDGLVLLFLFGGDNDNITGAGFSSPSIATDNPTWTSRSNLYVNVSSLTLFSRLYTAPRAAATAFGNISWSVDDGTGSGVGVVAVMLNLAPEINGSHAVQTAPSYLVNHPFLRRELLTIDGQDPTTNSREVTQWQNETKATTTWTNQTK